MNRVEMFHDDTLGMDEGEWANMSILEDVYLRMMRAPQAVFLTSDEWMAAHAEMAEKVADTWGMPLADPNVPYAHFICAGLPVVHAPWLNKVA